VKVMKNLNVNNIVEAKSEYTKQLYSVLTEPLCMKMISLYNACPKVSDDDKPLNHLIEMQKAMRHIPDWNAYNIDNLTREVTKDCPYFSDLLAAVFVSNIRILTSIHMSKKKIHINLPKAETFVHTTCVHVAEAVFHNPQIFKKDLISLKKDLSMIIRECADESIRGMLPLQNIFQNYNTANSDSESDEKEKDDEDECPGPPDDIAGDEGEGEFGDDGIEEPIENAEHGIPLTPSAPVTASAPDDFFSNDNDTKSFPINDKSGAPPPTESSPFGELQDEDTTT